MQIYAVASRTAPYARMDLAESVRRAGAAMPALRDGARFSAASSDGGLEVAALSHRPEAALARRYVAREADTVVLYDGLPVARDGSFAAHDAGVLLQRWDTAADDVTGLFSAVRVDLERRAADVVTDAVGMAQVFVHQRGDAWVLSNSVEVIRHFLGLTDVDPLGMSSLLSIGWVMGRRTLIAGVTSLPGGHVHRLNGNGPVSRQDYLGTAAIARLREEQPTPESLETIAERLRLQTVAIGAMAQPVRCGVTAGRDTRVLLALLASAGVEADYYTIGPEGSPDVTMARRLTEAVGARHRRLEPELPPTDGEWAAATAEYVGQTDGLAVLSSVGDWWVHRSPDGPLGVRMWGMAGEIGRGGVGLGVPLAPALRGVRASASMQRKLVLKRLAPAGGVVAASALAESTRYVDDFLSARRAEGWPVGELAQAFYHCERMGQWAASGLRRTLAGADQYTPFTTRDFVEYSFSISAAERFLESPHYGLLSQLDRRLRDMPFERGWRWQRPRAAVAIGLAEAAPGVVRRLRRRRPAQEPRRAPTHFGMRWIEHGLGHHRELVDGHPDSPVWEFADRHRVQALVAGAPEDRWPHLENLGRVLTAVWYLHGER